MRSPRPRQGGGQPPLRSPRGYLSERSGPDCPEDGAHPVPKVEVPTRFDMDTEHGRNNHVRPRASRRRRNRCLSWDASVHEPLVRDGVGESPESFVLRKEADERVQAVLDRMRPRNKQALVLREYAGLSCQDIGAMMGVSHKAVKSML